MPIGSDAAKMAGLALMAVLLVVAPQWAMGATKQMKMSKTLSFDDNIGDALADLIGGLKDQKGGSGGDKTCQYKCESGKKAKKIENHEPEVDGCKFKGFNIEIDGYDMDKIEQSYVDHDLDKCCNKHDKCYGTFGNSKTHCDDTLYKCLDKKCAAADSSCKDSIQFMKEWQSQAVGCNVYKMRQEEATDCGVPKKKKDNQLKLQTPIKDGTYCAKLNVLMKVEVNLEVSSNMVAFEGFLNGNKVVQKCEGNYFSIVDSVITLNPQKTACYNEVINKYGLANVEFDIRWNAKESAIDVTASNVPLVNTVSLQFTQAACNEDAALGDGGVDFDFALHDDSEL